MFIRIENDQYVNLARVAFVQRVGNAASEGVSYMFYGESKNLLAQTEYGSRFNSDIEKALDNRKEAF